MAALVDYTQKPDTPLCLPAARRSELERVAAQGAAAGGGTPR